MTAPNYEVAANLAATTLNGGIDDTTTTVVVTDGTVFPSTGNFRIRVDSELMLVTARSTHTLTVERGIESTTGASHLDTTTVRLVATGGAVERFLEDGWFNVGYGRPLGIYNDAGTDRLVSTDFTAINQETATVEDQVGTILLRCPPASGTDLRLFCRTAPSTPYAYIGAFQCCCPLGNSGNEAQHFGMGFRESSTGEFTVLMYVTQGHTSGATPAPHRLQVREWAGPSSSTFTTIRDEHTVVFSGPLLWVKIEDDGTDLHFYVGLDSENWILIHSVDRDTHLATGPDQVFWYGQNSGFDNDGLFRLVHWSLE